MRRLIIALAACAVALPAAAQPTTPRPDVASAPTPPVSPVTTPPVERSIAFRVTPTRETCSWLVRTNGVLTKLDATPPRLLTTEGQLTLPIASGKLEGIYCERDSMVPAENDDRVPRMGIPLFLNGPSGLTTVRIANGRYNVTFSEKSTMTKEQQDAVRAVVARWEARAGR